MCLIRKVPRAPQQNLAPYLVTLPVIPSAFYWRWEFCLLAVHSHFPRTWPLARAQSWLSIQPSRRPSAPFLRDPPSESVPALTPSSWLSLRTSLLSELPATAIQGRLPLEPTIQLSLFLRADCRQIATTCLDFRTGRPRLRRFWSRRPPPRLGRRSVVNISNLIVDGANNGLSSCATDLVGIYYQNASGTVNHVTDSQSGTHPRFVRLSGRSGHLCPERLRQRRNSERHHRKQQRS